MNNTLPINMFTSNSVNVHADPSIKELLRQVNSISSCGLTFTTNASPPIHGLSFAAPSYGWRNLHVNSVLSYTSEFYNSIVTVIGHYVEMSSEYGGLPVIPRHGNRPAYLYEFVEVLDELVDYNDIIEKLPGLSFSQIYGAISFLRRLAQFNRSGVDIDDFEQRFLAQDPEFLSELRSALADQEGMRVLNNGEQDGG